MTNREKIINRKLAEISDRIQNGRNFNILYIVCDDRNIHNYIFSCANFPKVLSLLVGDKRYQELYKDTLPPNLPGKLQYSHEIADVPGLFESVRLESICTGGFTPAHLSEKLKVKNPPHIFMLHDFHVLYDIPKLKDPGMNLLHKFMYFAEKSADKTNKMLLLIISPIMNIPLGFEQEMVVLDVPAVGESEITEYILKHYDVPPEAADKVRSIAYEFKGLDFSDIDHIMDQIFDRYHAYFGDEVTEYRKKKINESKEDKAKQDSTITIIRPQNNVSGMEEIENWCKRNIRHYVYAAQAKKLGIVRPNGILLCGLPGTGKTQMAKKLAHDMTEMNGNMSIPLIQFRMDNILGGLVGDSEKNFKRCRKKIEALAPCIVLFDEIEKTFSNKDGSQNADHKMNILSALLEWLQENDKVFFYATCNGTSIPPEILREGRFDMKFSLFLPPQEELEQIMKFHLNRFNSPDYADGRLFHNKTDIDALIKAFFDQVTEISKKDKQYRFFTGSNIESLIKKTNINISSTEKKLPYDHTDYLNALIETVKSNESQPYGTTNMSDIIDYWFMAQKNNYLEAAVPNLFAFSDFDMDKAVWKYTEAKSEYNKWMMDTIRAKIAAEAQKRQKSEKPLG